MSSEFVINELTALTLFLCSMIRDILYFCAGAVVFVILLSAPPIIKNLETKGIRFYALCVFVIWCWIYSKIIVL